MATSEDERFYGSDAEVDSELEDNDLDTTFGNLLDQLHSQGNVKSIGEKKLPPSISQKQVIESFRKSILINGGDDIDLDALLGDLCALEAQITTQQQDINTDLQKSGQHKQPQTFSQQPSFSYEWDDDIDTELQGALDALSELTRDDNQGGRVKTAPTEPAILDFPNSSSEGSFHAFTGETSSQTGTIKRQPANTEHGYVGGNKKPPLSPTRHTTIPSTNRSSASNFVMGNGSTYQNFEQDLSPMSLEIDSAFSDSGSLPSSGSHGSVATSGSQQSGRSSSGASSGTGSGTDTAPPVSPNEQANKLKAEKVKIALEKIKEANIKKLFVRAHTADGCSKSILADEQMSVAHVVDILMAKNHVNPSLHWSLVEQIPELDMERLMEDHDNLVEYMLHWTRDSPNKMFFVERTDKYAMFSTPEKYLVAEHTDGEEYSEDKRDGLLKEYFSGSQPVAPELEGMLYLKAEGKKAWKKFLFVLRGSGLYYNPKGKSKSSKDLQCLQKFDFADVYVGLNWRKKFKSPTDYGFALKHPQIQKKSKFIKYVAVDNGAALEKWVTAIRIAKYGCQLRKNFENMKNNITTFNYRDVSNPNFNDYVAKHNQVVEQYSRTGHRISKSDQVSTLPDFGRRATSMREPKTSSLKNYRNSTASITSSSSRGSVKSGSSGANRSPVKVVIPPPRKGSLGAEIDRTSVDGLQSTSEVMFSSADSSSTVIMKNSSSSGSITEDGSQLQQPIRRRHSDNNILQDSPVRKVNSEAFEDIPSCGLPSLPVNTKVTKLITEQHALTGTLRQPSMARKMKKSTSKGSDIDVTDLPPPPPDPHLPPVEFLPPPPDDMLHPPSPPPPPLDTSSTSLQRMYSLTQEEADFAAVVDDMSVRTTHTRAPSAGSIPVSSPLPPAVTGIVTSASFHDQPQRGSNAIHPTAQFVDKGHILSADGVSGVKSAPATPKKCPPPPPKKPEAGWSSNASTPCKVSPTRPAMPGATRPAVPAHTQPAVPGATRPVVPGHAQQATPPHTAPKTSYFINDLQRVLHEKHSRQLQPSSSLPPEPPMPFQSRIDTHLPDFPEFNDLPPPPAELLEDLKQIKKRPPPPPPKRKV